VASTDTVDNGVQVSPDSSLDQTRRGFLGRLTAAVAAIGALVAGWPLLRSLVPNVLYEPPKRFRIGNPERFQEGVTFLEEHRIFLFRESSSFHAISGICTHLGCTVKFSPFTLPQEETVRQFTYRALGEFHCPCHGSKFRGEGTNFSGPAPRPLTCYHLELSPATGELVVDTATDVPRDFRLVV
jgi:menaquinol-cytochrome c reductase iron-sulfur subunit